MSSRNPTREARLRRLGVAACAVVLAELASTVLLGRGIGGAAIVPYPDLVGDLAIVSAATLLTVRRPTNAIGWLLVAFAGLGATQNLGSVYGVRAVDFPAEHLPYGSFALSLGDSLWIPALFVPLTLLPVLYPDGSVPAAWWHWVNTAAVAGMVAATVVAGTDAGSARDDVTGGRPVGTLSNGVALAIGIAAGVLLTGSTLLSVGGLFMRIWHARYPQRQQMLWLVTTALIAVPLLFVALNRWWFAVALSLVPLAIAVGVLRYRLLGIEAVIRRVLVYGLLTSIVVGIYAGMSAVISVLVPTGPAPAVVAAAAVAVALSPVRDRLQRAVDRLVYGARHDPLGAVHRVGAHLSGTSVDPLAGVAASVAAAVRARYVAVTNPDGALLAESGDVAAFPRTTYRLTAGGEHVGDLSIVAAASERSLAAADQRLVDALAVPVAVVVHASRLNADLAAARARIVDAIARERSRLRHDLHDGLGPSLSGVALGLEAVETTVAHQPERATQIITRLRVEVAHAVEDVRRIIDALRPAALESGGLGPALRARAAAATQASCHRLRVDVEIPADLPELPESVEIAAFRIVDEAVTNAVRHSAGTRCVVRLSLDGVPVSDLVIDVSDDGRGFGDVRPGGIGLISMCQRAEELGGTFSAGGDAGGHVIARLPLRTRMPAEATP